MIATAGAMVVLGEPGSGKTSVLSQLTEELPSVIDPWEGTTAACLWINGGNLTEASYQEELGCHFDGLPPAGVTTGETGVLWVVLDQMDESPLRLHLARRLERSLRGRDTSRVRFLMACRTDDYPPTMTAVLSKAFKACWRVDLAPLSREDAVALADSAGVPGQDLIAAAEEAGAAVLASIPLTLELLVLTYQRDGQLHGKPENLFARGVTLLAEGRDPQRFGSSGVTSASQRESLAGRIAAQMLLSGHRSVWLGHVFEAGAFDAPGDALLDDLEQGTTGSYRVTRQMLLETLATALFTAPEENRRAFRHSSVTAYLAARYLTEQKTNEQQLKNLFLVGAPDGETASIPAPLRETAAWLVAMNPNATRWLADADPESLAVHSALVRSDEVRQLTVSRLLERAAQVELGNTGWSFTRWNLHYPGLADQLADVLETAPQEGAADWQSTARVRLAIKLAQEASTASPRLAEALLRLAENEAWGQAERRLAARAAHGCDADRAVPGLRRILASLMESSTAADIDPDHDLRGTVLSLLWPDHLDVETMLAALRPPREHMYGAMDGFLSTMSRQCPDEDLPRLLAWLGKGILAPDRSGSGFVFSHDYMNTTLIHSAVNRVLADDDPERYFHSLAKMILILLRGNHKVPLPECLQPDKHGQESRQVQELRRRVCHALVCEAAQVGVEPRLAAWMIAYDWQLPPSVRWNAPLLRERAIRHRLVDAVDFAWALDQTVQSAASGAVVLTAVYGELAARLFPVDDHEAFELAYDEDHPAWPHLRTFYEPIHLNSDLAQSLQRNHRAQEHQRWPAAEFTAKQARLLTQAREGDNDSLRQFLLRLRVEPQTGRLEDLSDSILAWPGVVALGDDLSDLPELALRYLTTEHDHADSWLQHSRSDWRAWTGYALLVNLHSNDQLADLPVSVWRRWAAAVLTQFTGRSTSYSEAPRRDLLQLTADHAPNTLARRITQRVTTALINGLQPLEINIVDPRWAPELQAAMEGLASGVATCLGLAASQAEGAVPALETRVDGPLVLADSEEGQEAALWTWDILLRSLLATGSGIANSMVDATLDGRSEAPLAARAAVQAAHSLLITDAEAHWARVKAFTATDAEFGRGLAEACARTETGHQIHGSLSDAGVADLYQWLSNLYPEEEDQRDLGMHWVTPEEEARTWRDRLLRELSRRATAGAVHQLRKLAIQFPERLAVAAAVVAATKEYAAASWKQMSTRDVTRVLQDSSRRVIRNSIDLLDVVYEVLEQVARDLPQHGELLWDRTPGRRREKSATAAADQPVADVWCPKPEAALCAYLTHELNLRLVRHRVAVNREVLIQPTNDFGAGDRTDILIDALPSLEDAPIGKPLKLIIEVKGAWNADVMTAQKDQLAGRYLPETNTDVGIYLVGWYPIELWSPTGERGRARAERLATSHKLLADLQDQATQLSRTDSVHLRPLVITIERPRKR
ncbi:hypothetical protein [Streptomyces marispadix]|uniref:NACHT domain-containing protein n=1 Tax=Streptomyces marispadix TaxID=2922868 RepID=A0ABS9SYZ4_9ACTN|nr:hypothetical protein [Streptomyces marispadix]MCH6161487.1 hypothetical protein [Streptomyces marispadix]